MAESCSTSFQRRSHGGGVVASVECAVAGSTALKTGCCGGRRGLLWSVDGTSSSPVPRRRGDRTERRRLRRRRQRRATAVVSAAARRSARVFGKGAGGDPEGWKRVMERMLADAADLLCPGGNGDPARGHKPPLAHEWPASAAPSRRATTPTGGQRSAPTTTAPRSVPIWCRANSSARRSPGLLLWRHGGRAHRAIPSGALTMAACSRAHRAGARLCAERAMPSALSARWVVFACSPARDRSRRARVIATNGYTTDLTPT